VSLPGAGFLWLPTVAGSDFTVSDRP